MPRERSISKHCTKCEKGKPCNKGKKNDYHHVYVIELKDSIWEEKKFRDRNENTYIEGKPLVYVGMTSHLPQCRRSQHFMDRRPKKNPNKEPLQYDCYCKDGKPKRKESKLANGFSRWLRPHCTYRLLSKYYKPGPWGKNPQKSREDSEKAECRLADYLRSKGLGVWEGKRHENCDEEYHF